MVSGQLKVHYIDVGQGDSILIQQGSENMLIDTGTNSSAKSLINYLEAQNIKKIDVLVLTHPHEDHIGGADVVIKEFDIGAIYMPKITSTTETFKDVISAISSKGLKIISPKPGDIIKLGDAVSTILGPISSNDKDLNTYSIVLKLAFGNNKFLFTGDAEASTEKDMINKGYDLSADILKVGHHGSDTSTSQGFLDKVNPKYAIISVGKENNYGHPHLLTMDKLKIKNIPVYRTDEKGTILVTSDGNNITFNSKVESSTQTPVPQTEENVNVSASVDNPTPIQNSTINLSVGGPAGASVTAVCHFKSTNTTYNGRVGTPIAIKVGKASHGVTVNIDIVVSINGKVYNTQTSFTTK
ncbi:MAG: MBL fold metallo-hydrolase [Clostridiaceae bacterium]|nr:MBL fold metallo-hydrolase [Clostridiaceae bacterium]